jgi:hypothetical protein
MCGGRAGGDYLDLLVRGGLRSKGKRTPLSMDALSTLASCKLTTPAKAGWESGGAGFVRIANMVTVELEAKLELHHAEKSDVVGKGPSDT